MKTIVLIVVLFISYSSSCQVEMSKELPPMSMLPKKGEVKTIYELPSSIEHKVYNKKGKLILEGKGKWIDFTKYKKGTYYIKYDDQNVRFVKEKK
jgi:hypothetical protein